MSSSEWETYSFQELTANYDCMRKPLSSNERKKMQGKYPYYGAQGIIDSINNYIFDGTYMLVAEDGENLKSKKQNIAQIVSGKFWVNNHAHIVKESELADLRYLCYLFNNTDVSGYITGSAQPKLSQANLNLIKFTVPCLTEQKAIAATLSCLDDKIELNNRINKNLEEIAQAIFKSWFVDFEPFQDGEFEDSELGRIPKGWRVGTIEEFVKEMKNGGTPNRKNDNYWDSKDVPWLKTGEIKNSLIIESEEYISWAGLKNSSAKILPYNSVLMAMYGATAGKIGLLKFEASTNQACCAMTCNSANKAIFLYLFLLANQSYIESLAVGAAQQNLNKDTISKLKLIIPKDEVIESVIFDELFNYIENNFRETQKLNAIRDTLLPKLMSGEIRVPIEEVQ
ncbi:MAG: restriction endonuclease subunit S [Dehalobacterium sp.]|jgi:type I restriction enzyme S subunit